MTEALLEQAAPLELRISGRTLRAEMPYGERARDRAERFQPGSIRPMYPVTLNVQHDPALTIATTADRSLRLRDTDTALIVEADLKVVAGGEDYGALGLVRRGAMKGISPEFYARRAHIDSGLRVITEADVPAFGLVDTGSYSTPLELRAGALLSSVIPIGHRCSCECAGKDCDSVLFGPQSLDDLVDGPGDVIAHTGKLDASSILGSKAAGSLLLARTEAGVTLTLTEAATPAGAAVRAAAAVSVIHARPLIDVDASESVIEGAVRRYTAAVVTGILVKTAPPDRREGWEPAKVADPDPEARARRLWL